MSERYRSSSPPKRSRRITRACDRCHHSNTKCAPGPSASTCAPCYSFGEQCTYDRPVKQRGPRARSRQDSAIPSRSPYQSVRDDEAWHCDPVASDKDIDTLTESYLLIVYPIFPLFHWPSFRNRIHRRDYKTDRAFSATTMAVCAIVAARFRNGATALPAAANSFPSSKVFYQAACQAIPHSLTLAAAFDYRRAKALLAILCVQHGDIPNLHTHLGDYNTLSLNEGFYDESRWPVGISVVELQERRRLFWSTYTLEIFTAITWGGIVRHRQSQCNVLFPAEVISDDDITENGCLMRGVPADSFLHGWNATTEMYRLLEHLVDRMSSKRLQRGGSMSAMASLIISTPQPSYSEILTLAEKIHSDLPPIFKGVRAMSGDPAQDRFGFQATNLIVTLQTVKMVLAGTEESSIEQRCAIAGSLIDALGTIPTAYIAAISTPMLHHLASVGHLLASIIQSPLSQWSLLQLQGVLSALANLISGLESVLSISSNISTRLRSHVDIINQRIGEMTRTAAQNHVYHSAVPPQSTINGNPPGTPLLSLDQQAPSITDPTQQVFPDFNFAFSPDHQIQLQQDLTSAWPFDFDIGGLFDFNGELGDRSAPVL